MKQLFATFAAIALASTIHAQSLSTGFRLGYTAFADRSGLGHPSAPFDYQQGSVTPELFARYAAKKHWAFELGLSTSTLRYEERVSAVGTTWTNGLQKTASHSYELGLAAQYELTCHRMAKTAAPRRFHYYMGLSATAALVHDRGEVYTSDYPETSVMTTVSNDFQLWGGLNHTIVYDLSGRWSLTATGDLRVNLNSLTGIGYSYGRSYPDASMGLRIGAAYRLWNKR